MASAATIAIEDIQRMIFNTLVRLHGCLRSQVCMMSTTIFGSYLWTSVTFQNGKVDSENEIRIFLTIYILMSLRLPLTPPSKRIRAL